ncbi:hypothetical protein CYMTET_8221 [Cymbomonas tetramitiformis]|uniref:Deacetylase sirtuin-type domain-containing protein n=1 Tax=Cymbomonas tetramitiformis TaxID=36881 RepID=A0AAE0GU17_9CHLO|nr:hypothetical protein CYMTET_8221 [Cymbomonas tetramitiformis]|eukprot:gene10065-11909_t
MPIQSMLRLVLRCKHPLTEIVFPALVSLRLRLPIFCPFFVVKLVARIRDAEGNTPFLLACSRGDQTALSVLLSTDPLVTNRDGCNGLHLACYSGHYPCVTWILDNVGQLACTATKFSGLTALHIAACDGHFESVRALLDHGVLVDAQSPQGQTALLMACCNGHEECVRLLLDAGADALIRTGGGLDGCLKLATRNGYLNCVEVLLQEGKHVQNPSDSSNLLKLLQLGDRKNRCALHFASLDGHVDIARILIEAGAEVDAVSVDGATPLHLAAAAGHFHVVKLLLQNHANTTRADAFGSVPLHEACSRRHPQVIKELLSSRSPAEVWDQTQAQDNDGLTPLHKVCQPDPEVAHRPVGDATQADLSLNLLFDAGADPNSTDYGEATALHILCFSSAQPGSLILARRLLDAGADPFAEFEHGWNAFHILHNTPSASDELLEMLTSHTEEHSPERLHGLEWDKRRVVKNTNYLLRRGPHNRIPLEQRQGVLGGNCTLQGFADYLMQFSSKYGRQPRVVVLTGAGISVSAGIPDFRSPTTGLYASAAFRNAFSLECLVEQPEVFYAMCHDVMLPVAQGKFRPTAAHRFQHLLHQHGLLHRVYTQNIDTFERIVGVPEEKLVASHGSFETAYCMSCGEAADMAEFWRVVETRGVPRCSQCCTGIIRPSITFFGEGLPTRFAELSAVDMAQADALIVMGTSLLVYPFAALVNQVPLLTPRLLINKEKTGVFRGIPSAEDDALITGNEGASTYNYRDVAYVGDCDDGVRKLESCLGWS